ncbi:hypothetical protein CYLTODRAFT_362575 [Cylindrobasidium torrendii FP15055 ss-10]|uniref:Uncharacterized protein n=1 Tax=Cylindrobasidium torrendii FP15055 ss-10 TaxID=1314674 RepID=A0A0D7AUW8_9AGAR|nr:hypothetical protein CYLTODRAFT_362575 [Cylindrobasidium torrendii FP15055 ss-10]
MPGYEPSLLQLLRLTLSSKIRPIINRDNLVVAVIVDQPRDDPSYGEACMRAFRAMCDAEGKLKAGVHTRGRHCAANVGILMGQGQQEPTPTRLGTGTLAKLIRHLVGHDGFVRMATYASAAFQVWAPRLHDHFHTASEELHQHRPDLPRNFQRSVFPMCCFNMGRRVRCWKHRDVMNVPYGWCAITALGKFDHTRSAFLVLWELGIYVEFPHGCTVYVPSASITHSNSMIVGDEEERGSFTQYFPGAILRWLDNHCQTDRALKASNPLMFADLARWKKERWERGLAMFSTWDEVRSNLSSI